MTARPAHVRLADAVVEPIVKQYADPGERDRDALLLITTRPTLRDAFVDTATAIEHPSPPRSPSALVLAASVAAAVRVALQQWVQPAAAPPATGGLVVPSGSLPDLLRTARNREAGQGG